MDSSDILKIFAAANRKIGMLRNDKNFIDYANLLENTAAVYEANEVIRKVENERT